MKKTIEKIVEESVARRASDIHICKGVPVKLRVDGKLVNLDENVLSAEDCEEYARLISKKYDSISEMGEQDLSASIVEGIRCRINVYKESGVASIAIRLLNNKIPSFGFLGLPPVINQLVKQKRGLILVTGQTGSGKSTTLAYMINEINKNQSKHIVTLEDPIEYIHDPIMSIVSQREVGMDTRSFRAGLNAVLREDPDVIMIGELRTFEEIDTALTIAETGHLVLASLHTNSAAETVDRIVDVFPAQQQSQVRLQLSMTLNAVICQQLIPHACGKGRVLATEVMVANDAIRNLIREGKTPQIENSIVTSSDIGGCLMDNSLISLYKQSKITREETLRNAHNLDYVGKAVR